MKVHLSLIFAFLAAVCLGQQPDSSRTTLGGGMDFNYGDAQTYKIGPIRVNGADNFDQQAIKLIAGLRTGDEITIPGDRISKAIKNLWNEGLFSSVEIVAEKEIAGVIYLAINLAPRQKLSRMKFKGASRRDVDKIREEIKLQSGQTITENLIFTTQNKIKAFYKEKGYEKIQVNINRIQDTLINNSEIFLIDITRGEKVKIKEIIIEGTDAIPMWKLKMAMKETKKKGILRLFKRSKFNYTSYQKDKEAILDKLRGTGLRDVYLSSDSVYTIDEKNMGIYMKINEGGKYFFGDISWIGNTKFSTGALDTVLGLKYDDEYNKPLLNQRLNQSQDGRDIASVYMDHGSLFFNVQAIETSVKDNHINYEMRIIEGKEARVRNIIIKGNTKTNEHVIRREIRTKPGDLFSRNDIIRTQRELAQLGYFNDQTMQINPIPNPQDGTVDIEYILEEKSADQIELSGGYGAGRLIGTLGLTFSNFSLRNCFKKDGWQPIPAGDGQRISIRAQSNGRFYQGYNFSFTEPWLGGKKPNSLSIFTNYTAFTGQASKGTRKDPTYSGIGILSAGVGIGRKKKIPDDFFSAYYEASYSLYDVRNYPNFFQGIETGKANDYSFKYNLQRNSVFSPIYPQEGSRLTLSTKATLPYSLMGGKKDFTGATAEERYKYLEYFKIKFTGEYYLPLTRDKKLVLSPRFGFGFLGFYNASKGLSPFERFSLGGSGLTGAQQFGGKEIVALRGYDNNEISSTTGDPIISKLTLELRYPISLNPQATFFVTAWGEAGNTYTSFKTFNPFRVKRAAGVGLRVFLPMFGMLGVDLGYGFDGLDAHSSGYGSADDVLRINNGFKLRPSFTIGMNLGEL